MYCSNTDSIEIVCMYVYLDVLFKYRQYWNCMYVCMYACMYACMYVFMHVYYCGSMFRSTLKKTICMYVYMYVCMFV